MAVLAPFRTSTFDHQNLTFKHQYVLVPVLSKPLPREKISEDVTLPGTIGQPAWLGSSRQLAGSSRKYHDSAPRTNSTTPANV